jgi:hypothetical protein|tara:strand:+ start:138 stop:278 length:141 start_codon:yes stop_codon:yes gene_type:complete
MSYNRLPKRNKVSKPEDVFVVKGGKKYKVLTIGGAKVEVAADVFTF